MNHLWFTITEMPLVHRLRSISGSHHIAIHNYDNSFCHHLSAIQKIHTSMSLNRLLTKTSLENIDDPLIRDVIEPLYYYAIYDESMRNGDNDPLIEEQLHTQLKDYFSRFVNEYVAMSGLHGYFPMHIMVYLIIPCIWKLCMDHNNGKLFAAIINELHMDPIDFNSVEYVAKDLITGPDTAYLKNEYSERQLSLYLEMISANVIPKEMPRSMFIASVLEVYPNADKTGGHAIVIIRGSDKQYYVIDDQNAITLLSDYYETRKERLHSITIRDVDEETIANLNGIIRGCCKVSSDCAFSKRISRYELDLSNTFTKAADVIHNDRLINGANTDSLTDTELDDNEEPRKSLYCMVLFIGLVIGVFIGVLVMILYRRQNVHQIQFNGCNCSGRRL